ncbi:unnamed protein product [Allacma fusca]|uniref:Uncharacterized protein n=1 Tax=Allacma fusca TaxID=39272 RepID=A0A8J2P7R7_9HEXA|nr:unnamed protein product [Allacma fusca]
MNLRSVRELRFFDDSFPIANFSERFNGPCREIKIFSDNVTPMIVASCLTDVPPAYNDFLPINLAKVTNLKILFPHISFGPEVVFFDTVYAFNSEGYRVYL